MSSIHLSFRRVCGLLCALPIVFDGGPSEHALALPAHDIAAVQRWRGHHPRLPTAEVPGTL